MTRRMLDAESLAADVLAGNRLAVARTMTQIENRTALGQSLLAAIYPHTGRAHIIGVTGAPGTGKSTLVAALARHFRNRDETVGIVAVDPTSPYTGGALLGDRVRMRALSGDAGIFIRSVATRGSLGGLSRSAGDLVNVLDAAGFDRIIVETVGVGQAEVEIAGTAHTTLVVEAPGLGDEVQAIKAGILEIADIVVVNKADRPGADRTARALHLMLEVDQGVAGTVHHGAPAPMAGDVASDAGHWQIEILKTVAATDDGVDALAAQIEAHRRHLQGSDGWDARERTRAAHALESVLRAELEERLAAVMTTDKLTPLIDAIQHRTHTPAEVGEVLLRWLVW